MTEINFESEIFRLNLKIKELKIKSDTECAQNSRLAEENKKLLNEMQELTQNFNFCSNISLEYKMQLHKVQSEREEISDALNRLKKRYNKLHEKYLVKAKRVASLEEVFRKQKTLPHIVRKGEFDIVGSLNETKINDERATSKIQLERKIDKLQEKLYKAHDIIDGLEFELESVEFLESEVDYLRNELKKFQDVLLPEADATVADEPDSVSDNQSCCMNKDNTVVMSSDIQFELGKLKRELLRAELEAVIKERES